MLSKVITAVKDNWKAGWKTTLSGILTFGCMIVIVGFPEYKETAMDVAVIAIATGLISAGDATKVTSLLRGRVVPPTSTPEQIAESKEWKDEWGPKWEESEKK